jgi:hypothetical protein
MDNLDVRLFVGLDPSLVPPCEIGWKNSVIAYAGIDDYNAPACGANFVWSPLDFVSPLEQGCTFSIFEGFLGGSCIVESAAAANRALTTAEQSPPYGSIELDIPGGAKYFMLDYQLSNMQAGDYVAILMDGQLVWQMSGSNVPEGEWKSTGPIPLSGHVGSSLLMVVMYSSSDGATFGWQNLQFLMSESIFGNGFE